MKTIFVPLDFSDVTAPQLELMQTHLPDGPCRVILAHVHHAEAPLDNATSIEVDREYATVERGQLAEAVQRTRSNLATREEVVVESMFCSGPVSATLLSIIDVEKVDLVVMGTHGHGRLFSLVMGSVAEALLRKSQVPVLFVPPIKDA